MKIAVITDVHSNFHSLSAILDDIAAEKPDLVVGAGDMVGCSAYPGAVDVWNILHDKEIPFVLGNEEERILSFYNPMSDPYLKNSVQFMPLQYRARQFSVNSIEMMRILPMNIMIDGRTLIPTDRRKPTPTPGWRRKLVLSCPWTWCIR